MTWKEQALEHAQDLSPDEACGVIYLHKGKERFMPCKNIAFDKQNTFTIDPKDWAVAEEKGDIVGIFHSHTNCDPLRELHLLQQAPILLLVECPPLTFGFI